MVSLVEKVVSFRPSISFLLVFKRIFPCLIYPVMVTGILYLLEMVFTGNRHDKSSKVGNYLEN